MRRHSSSRIASAVKHSSSALEVWNRIGVHRLSSQSIAKLLPARRETRGRPHIVTATGFPRPCDHSAAAEACALRPLRQLIQASGELRATWVTSRQSPVSMVFWGDLIPVEVSCGR